MTPVKQGRETGYYLTVPVAGEDVKAFIPFPLPPSNPPFAATEEVLRSLARAEQATLHVSEQLRWKQGDQDAQQDLLIEEALASSRIEGVEASIQQVRAALEGKAPISPGAEEVLNCLDAMNYATSQLKDPRGLPISMRLINGIHRHLMDGPNGRSKRPGEIRTSQNWIGGSRPGNASLVPPPPQLLPEVLSQLEHYIHGFDSLHPLIRAGLAHVQFETIHPYLDGNGRTGRILITLLLMHWGLLDAPVLPLSCFLEPKKQLYYDHLGAIRTDGDWEGWTAFFLEAVADAAEAAAVRLS